jgi:hypothetical protein
MRCGYERSRRVEPAERRDYVTRPCQWIVGLVRGLAGIDGARDAAKSTVMAADARGRPTPI